MMEVRHKDKKPRGHAASGEIEWSGLPLSHPQVYHEFVGLSIGFASNFYKFVRNAPLFNLYLTGLRLANEAGAEAEWRDRIGDREGFWQARRAMLRHQAIVRSLAEVLRGWA